MISPADLFKQASPGKLLVSFDFDGTLSPIVPTPEEVRFPPAMIDALARAHRVAPIVICSGRSVESLRSYIPDHTGVDLIGNHGLEWRFASGEERDLTPPDWNPWRLQLLPKLEGQVTRNRGRIEDKIHSIGIHFRLSGEEYWTSREAENWLRGELQGVSDLMEGKMCWNLVPRGASKGMALAKYAQEFGYQRLIYFGDEHTDETVFERRGKVPGLEIIGVRVGEGATKAQFRVPDVQDVRNWLTQLSMLDSGLM